MTSLDWTKAKKHKPYVKKKLKAHPLEQKESFINLCKNQNKERLAEIESTFAEFKYIQKQKKLARKFSKDNPLRWIKKRSG